MNSTDWKIPNAYQTLRGFSQLTQATAADALLLPRDFQRLREATSALYEAANLSEILDEKELGSLAQSAVHVHADFSFTFSLYSTKSSLEKKQLKLELLPQLERLAQSTFDISSTEKEPAYYSSEHPIICSQVLEGFLKRFKENSLKHLDTPYTESCRELRKAAYTLNDLFLNILYQPSQKVFLEQFQCCFPVLQDLTSNKAALELLRENDTPFDKSMRNVIGRVKTRLEKSNSLDPAARFSLNELINSKGICGKIQ